MDVCFFEDGGGKLFAPLTLTRPVDDLRIGVLTIREKWEHYLKSARICRLGRKPLDLLFRSDLPEDVREVLWINARWLPDPEAARRASSLGTRQALVYNGTAVAFRTGAKESKKCYYEGFGAVFSNGRADSPGIRDREPGWELLETKEGQLLNYLWDLFQKNGQEIARDVALLRKVNKRQPLFQPDAGVIVRQPENILCEPDARIDPGVIIDASDGPVYLGRQCHIMSGTMIQGPAAICEQAVVRMGTRIYSGTTVGPVCKAAGEIQKVIMLSHSNKAHDGYLGNSILGEWCNLGAHTTTSNLKNNYKPIKIPDWSTGRIHTSPIQFFGTVMGDHGKTAVNTTLSAGTLCGVFCNIFTYGFPPKHVPSFSWVSPHHTEDYQFEKAMETAEIMMSRRNIPLSRDYLNMMKYIFDHRNGVPDQRL